LKNKIGVALITCNSEHRIKQSAPLIPNVDEFVIVNDGEAYDESVYPDNMTKLIQHKYNTCVGVSKNDALKYLVDANCDHIFLVEDDVLIKDENVFDVYIKTAEKTGIWHLNYALQGPANRKQVNADSFKIDERGALSQKSDPNPKSIVEYDGLDLALYHNIVGSFSYYLKGVVKSVGLFDERYKNAWEHVEHTYRIIKQGLHPPFWWFADINESWKYIDDVENCIEESTIAKSPEWKKNFQVGMEMYRANHGFYPQKTPDVDNDEVMRILTNLEDKYARTVL